MGDRGQDLHALLHKACDALAHGVECARGTHQLRRTGLRQRLARGVRIERVSGIGQRHHRAQRQPHGQPAAQHQQQQLQHQHIRQPLRDGRRLRLHVDGQRAAVAEGEVRLQAFALPRDRFDLDREAAAARLGNAVSDLPGLLAHLRHARQARPEHILIVAAIDVP
ncbi:hypothetical protein D9M70_521360 [compost metagenome]